MTRTAHASTRRRLAAGPAGLAASAALAACGGTSAGSAGGATSGAGAAPAQLKAGSTLQFWNDQRNPYPQLMQQWADQFAAKHGVKVEVAGGIDKYDDKLAAAFAGGAPPDVFRYHSDNISIDSAVERNLLLGLDSYVKRDKYDVADFRKEALALYTWKGKLYALPRDYGLQLVFYNTDTFQRAGLPPVPADWNDKTWTFDKFLDAAKRLTVPGEQYALFVPRGDRLLASWIYSNGGALVKKDANGRATEMAIADKPAVDALQFVQDLMFRHKVAPAPAEEASIGTTQQLFQAGKLAMVLANPGQNSQYKPTGMPYDVGVWPLGPSGTRRGVGGGGTGWGAAAATKNPEEAWAFLAIISSREGEMAEVMINQITPSRTSVVTSKEYLAPPPAHSKVFADGQEFVVPDPVNARWPEASTVMTSALSAELWTGQATAQQVARKIKDQADLLLK